MYFLSYINTVFSVGVFEEVNVIRVLSPPSGTSNPFNPFSVVKLELNEAFDCPGPMTKKKGRRFIEYFDQEKILIGHWFKE